MSSAISGIRILPAEIESSQVRPKPGGGSTFGDVLRGAVAETDSLQQTAEEQIGEMMKGNGSDVHQAMISVEKADLSFQLMMQVRNKMVQAYQEISRLQF
jgi:flagellar hook-basal body complex protein FliE